MKYHFIYPDVNTGYLPSVHHGLAQLVAVLREGGHVVSLHHATKDDGKEMVSVVERLKPDIIGFTTMSNQVGYVDKWSRWIKQVRDVPIVCGGVHATLCPEELLRNEAIDMVCVGEGEKTILEEQFWIKRNGDIVQNMPYPLVENLDSLPFPDYSLFDMDYLLRIRNGAFAVIVSRGCPYRCTYCSNEALRERQKGLGKYFRYRSVDNTLAMLGSYIEQYSIRSFSFADDIFGLNRKWVLEFCEKYPKVINLPFDCNLRVESATCEILEALKRANCSMVEMGVESGNLWMRSEVLNRKMTNQQIIDAFENAHRVGIKTRAYNMIGLPYETSAMVRETLALNKLIQPDDVAVFYFYPFKGTRLRELCEREEFLGSQDSTNYIAESVLDLPTMTRSELKQLHGMFAQYVIAQKLASYPRVCRLLFTIVLIVLRAILRGSTVGVIRSMYIKLALMSICLRRK